MTKETYDLMINLGFEFLNYPPKSNQNNPTILKVTCSKVFGIPLIIRIPFYDARNFLTFTMNASYSLGKEIGSQDLKEFKKELTTLINKNMI